MTSTLVQFGRSGFVGRFAALAALPRGARVVVCGPRGVEPGVVLCEPGEKFAPALATEGDLLRVATPGDEARVAAFPEREADLLALAGDAAAERGLPLTFVDAELTLDDHLILHGLAWDACDATPLFAELSARFGLSVWLLDLSQTAVTKDPAPRRGLRQARLRHRGRRVFVVRHRQRRRVEGRLLDRLVFPRQGEVGRRHDRVLRGPAAEDGRRRRDAHAADLTQCVALG